MDDNELVELLDQRYRQGERQALIEILYATLRNLGYDATDKDALIGSMVNEREMTVKMLRRLCEEVGDNDWPDNLWIPDVIEKHLWNYLEDS